MELQMNVCLCVCVWHVRVSFGCNAEAYNCVGDNCHILEHRTKGYNIFVPCTKVWIIEIILNCCYLCSKFQKFL